MRDITLERAPVNAAALDAALRAALGEVVIGISASRDQVTVHLTDDATTQQLQQARAILVAHDPVQLTPEQAAAQARQMQLVTARANNAEPLDTANFQASEPDVQALVARLMWLELELRELRGW
jgi:hypothetical protein